MEQPRFGVVIDTRQSIFSNQNLHASVVTDVHAGKLLKIISEHGEWTQVMVQPGLVAGFPVLLEDFEEDFVGWKEVLFIGNIVS